MAKIGEWRYLPGGSVRHALGAVGLSIGSTAACGRTPGMFAARWAGDSWYGTGSQLEYDRCAALRPCRDCLRRGYAPSPAPPTTGSETPCTAPGTTATP